ncbi:DUF47 domain-containing protein [candidate division KSB1 bacterium]|nr:DUF47 domain-containing protein [candidate division KSB1 bacterium]
MFKSILPKEYSFFDFFEQHAGVIIRTCHELKFLAEGNGSMIDIVQRIEDLEHEADDVTHRCIDALHRTFITPIDRSDIHLLIKRLDDIVDSIDSATRRISLYDISSIRPEAKKLAEILVQCSETIEQALKGLRNMKHSESIIEKCRIIHDLEEKGDEVLRSALIRLFKEDDSVLIIKWKEIFQRLEKAVDRCEDVANIIEGVVISSS